MEVEKITLTNLKADQGKWLTNGTIFGKEILLGIDEPQDNWREITDEEKSNIETTWDWEDVE